MFRLSLFSRCPKRMPFCQCAGNLTGWLISPKNLRSNHDPLHHSQGTYVLATFPLWLAKRPMWYKCFGAHQSTDWARKPLRISLMAIQRSLAEGAVSLPWINRAVATGPPFSKMMKHVDPKGEHSEVRCRFGVSIDLKLEWFLSWSKRELDRSKGVEWLKFEMPGVVQLSQMVENWSVKEDVFSIQLPLHPATYCSWLRRCPQ